MSFTAPLRFANSIPVFRAYKLPPAYCSLSTRIPCRNRIPGLASNRVNSFSTMTDTRPVFFFDIDNCVRTPIPELTRPLLTSAHSSFTQEVRTALSRPPPCKQFVRLPANLRYGAENNIHDEMQKLIRTCNSSSRTEIRSQPSNSFSRR